MRSRTDRRLGFRSGGVEGDDGAVGEAGTFAEGCCRCMMRVACNAMRTGWD